MGQYFKKFAAKVLDKFADRIAWRVADVELADSIAYRVALETILNHSGANKKPNELFSGISDGFWFWLCTEGYRRNPSLASVLPGMPEENVQLMFTGDTGDSVLREGFSAYRLLKEVYESHIEIGRAHV